jgi:hypothetical protein
MRKAIASLLIAMTITISGFSQSTPVGKYLSAMPYPEMLEATASALTDVGLALKLADKDNGHFEGDGFAIRFLEGYDGKIMIEATFKDAAALEQYHSALKARITDLEEAQ